MAWIESHQSLLRHPKTMKAAELLGISRVQFIGHLHCLWWWALDFAEIDGNLGDISPIIIAEAAEFCKKIVKKSEKNIKKAENFCEILEKCGDNSTGHFEGFLEKRNGCYYLHDWYDYAGKLNVKRQKDRDRKRLDRQDDLGDLSTGSPTDKSNNIYKSVQRNSSATVPNRTVPNRTVPNKPPTVPLKKGDAQQDINNRDFKKTRRRSRNEGKTDPDRYIKQRYGHMVITGIECPECDSRNTNRLDKGDEFIWRVCLDCGHEWKREHTIPP